MATSVVVKVDSHLEMKMLDNTRAIATPTPTPIIGCFVAGARGCHPKPTVPRIGSLCPRKYRTRITTKTGAKARIPSGGIHSGHHS